VAKLIGDPPCGGGAGSDSLGRPAAVRAEDGCRRDVAGDRRMAVRLVAQRSRKIHRGEAVGRYRGIRVGSAVAPPVADRKDVVGHLQEADSLPVADEDTLDAQPSSRLTASRRAASAGVAPNSPSEASRRSASCQCRSRVWQSPVPGAADVGAATKPLPRNRMRASMPALSTANSISITSSAPPNAKT